MPNFYKNIPVYNGDMTELTRTSPAKARLLLDDKKAKVICTHPFVIRLNYVKQISEKDYKLLKNNRLKSEKGVTHHG